MSRPLLRRRQFLLSDFQNRFLLFNLLYFVTTVAFFAAVLFIPLMSALEDEVLSPTQRGEIAGEFLSLHARFWPAIPVLFVILAAHSVVISHRIAGPLVRFRRIFKEVAERDFSAKLKLRKKDYLEEDAEALNEMLGCLRSSVRSVRERATRLRTLLVDLQASASGKGDPALENLIAALLRAEEDLGTELETFKTGSETQ